MPVPVAHAPEVPSDIVQKLKVVDPRLGLRLVEYNTTETDKVQYWALALAWDDNDQRYKRLIDAGMMDPRGDFDVLGFLPIDCSLYDAENYVKNHLLQQKNRPDVNRMLGNLSKWNDAVVKEIIQPATEFAEELVKANATGLLEKDTGKRVPKVFMSGAKKE